MFKQGDSVAWWSHPGGYGTKKIGRVAAVVPAGTNPQAVLHTLDPRGYGPGKSEPTTRSFACRDVESYIVMVGRKLYWPIVEKLVRA